MKKIVKVFWSIWIFANCCLALSIDNKTENDFRLSFTLDDNEDTVDILAHQEIKVLDSVKEQLRFKSHGDLVYTINSIADTDAVALKHSDGSDVLFQVEVYQGEELLMSLSKYRKITIKEANDHDGFVATVIPTYVMTTGSDTVDHALGTLGKKIEHLPIGNWKCALY